MWLHTLNRNGFLQIMENIQGLLIISRLILIGPNLKLIRSTEDKHADPVTPAGSGRCFTLHEYQQNALQCHKVNRFLTAAKPLRLSINKQKLLRGEPSKPGFKWFRPFLKSFMFSFIPIPKLFWAIHNKLLKYAQPAMNTFCPLKDSARSWAHLSAQEFVSYCLSLISIF